VLLRLTIAALVIVALIVAIALVAAALRRRSERLKRRFGPEYDRALQERGDTRLAEAELQRRVRRVKRFRLRFLSAADQEAFWMEWAAVQHRFVDDPWLAVGAAEHLIIRVMSQCGYPFAEFEQRAADLSVNHSAVVQSYRAAHAIIWRREDGHATTEDLRSVMILYRSLLDALLTPAEHLNLQAIDIGGTGIDHKHAS
jgi:hypothetical protein